MSLTRCLYSVKYNRPLDVYSYTILRHFSVTCSVRNVKETSQPLVIDDDPLHFEKDVNVAGRADRRLAAIRPFMKDLFIGEFNRELLAYPEILVQEENETLNRHLAAIRDTLSHFTTKDSILKALRGHKILSAPVTAFHGGLASNVTERLRMLEDLSVDLQVAKLIAEHWAGLDSILLGMPKSDIEKIIPPIVEDGRLITMCLSEPMPEEPGLPDFKTSGILLPDGSWSLRGEKYCTTGDSYKVVVAVTPAYKVYPFLVAPSAPGQTYKDSKILFEDTPAIRLLDPSKINEEDDNSETLKAPVALLRLYKSVLPYARLNALIRETVAFVRGKYVGGKSYGDFPLAQDKILNAITTSYGSESIAYFTAGLQDGYHDPDISLESVICRIYNTERCARAAYDMMMTLRRDATLPAWEDKVKQIRDLMYEDWESNDTLHIYVALSGLQHAGNHMAGDIKKLRNPIYNPVFILKKMYENRFQTKDKPVLGMKLEEHLHPSLQDVAKSLEYSVLRLRYGSEELLKRYGAEIVETFRESKRLSEAACETYAMTAAIARSSRAHCDGGPDHVRKNINVILAIGLAEEAKANVKLLIQAIEDGEFINFDRNRADVSSVVMSNGGVVYEHALERVFW